MFTWTELKHKSKTCVAQLKLRVIVFSMLVALPAWLALTVLQRVALGNIADNAIRAAGVILLGVYIIGVVIIFRRTQRDHSLVCPHCKALLGPELRQVTDKGECVRCGEVIAKP